MERVLTGEAGADPTTRLSAGCQQRWIWESGLLSAFGFRIFLNPPCRSIGRMVKKRLFLATSPVGGALNNC